MNGATKADQMMEHFRNSATVVVKLASSPEPLDVTHILATNALPHLRHAQEQRHQVLGQHHVTPPQQQRGSQMHSAATLPRENLPTTHAGRPRSSTFCVSIPEEHLELLMTNHSLCSKFDEVYGSGASAAALASLEQTRRNSDNAWSEVVWEADCTSDVNVFFNQSNKNCLV